MKNIHILPTDKPSRLYLGNNGNFVFGMMQTSIQSRNDDFTNQNIYITSDEEIKEWDWCFDITENIVVRCLRTSSDSYWNKNCKKIILTTDNKDLIKDGVQTIDDEFLEWICKNPSCEEVEVKMNQGRYFDYGGNVHITNAYKIIIPKEETKLKNICIKCGVDLYATEGRFECQKHPKECKGIYLSKETLLIHAAEQKQHIIDMMKADEELGLYEEPKQQTLEEAAEKYAKQFDYAEDSSPYIDFIEGAKWQQERSYSDEEAGELVYNIMGEYAKRENIFFKGDLINNLFNKFKNK